MDSAVDTLRHNGLKVIEFLCKKLRNYYGILIFFLLSFLLYILESLKNNSGIKGVKHVHHVLLVGQLGLGEMGEILQNHVLVIHSMEAIPDSGNRELLEVSKRLI